MQSANATVISRMLSASLGTNLCPPCRLINLITLILTDRCIATSDIEHHRQTYDAITLIPSTRTQPSSSLLSSNAEVEAPHAIKLLQIVSDLISNKGLST
jgi:hypothetical protein